MNPDLAARLLRIPHAMAATRCAAILSSVLALTIGGSAAEARVHLDSHLSRELVECSVPGEWPRTKDAAWLWKRIRSVGYRDIGCTGSAFVIDYGGIGMYGHDLYIWAFSAPRLAVDRNQRRYRVIGGVRVYGSYPRVAWRAGRRNVWLESGPSSTRLPPLGVLARLVRATTVSQGSGRTIGNAGVAVVVPADWTSIPQRPAPSQGVLDPVVRILTSSGRLRYGRGCNELDYALEPTAVAIILVEWIRPTPGASLRPRPERFNERNLRVRRGLLECFPGRGGAIQFAQYGRRFAAFVLAANRASPASIDLARAVLNTLKVKRRT